MEVSADDQAGGERAIFVEFALVCGLPIRLSSIESRPSPEPDILCDVEGQGPLAFELGEVIGEALEQATNERVAVRRNFRIAYAALSSEDRAQIEACLGGAPALFVGFPNGMSPGKWRRAVEPILATLVVRSRATAEGDRLREGEVPVWRIPELRDLVSDVEVKRSSNGLPFLGVLEMTEVVDRTRRLLEKKFSRRYQSNAPIELLVYYVGAPPPRGPAWRAEVLHFIRNRRPYSPFRRVWLFNCFQRAIILVNPGSST